MSICDGAGAGRAGMTDTNKGKHHANKINHLVAYFLQFAIGL